MTLPRYYTVVDAYILEEARRKYEAANSRGRIRVLRELQTGGCLPLQIAMLAAHDPSSQVRQWFAHHCSNFFGVERGPGEEWEEQRRAWTLLVEALKGDSDPFVRACLRENPAVFGSWNSKAEFLEATHMERLALMRNPAVCTMLVEQVFDPQDTELGMDLDARSDLCRAFLSNEARLHELTDDARLCPEHKRAWDWEKEADARRFLSALWRLAWKWPHNSDIPQLVVNQVPAPTDVKAEIYRACPGLRQEILFNCRRGDDAVFGAALHDEDEDCRRIAYSNINILLFESGRVEELINRKDKLALESLAENESLSTYHFDKIEKSLHEIDPGGHPYVRTAISRRVRLGIPQDPDRLFGNDGRGLVEEKVNFIGILLTQTNARDEALDKKIGRALVWASVVGIAGVLGLLYLILR
jgi:hypothetical protein